MLRANGHAVDDRVFIGSQRYTIVPATERHLSLLAANLRSEDIAEIVGTGNSPKRSLWRGFRNSVGCQTAFVDGEIAAMWGLCVGFLPGLSLLSDVGRPWFLTSAAIERLPFSVVREGKIAVAAMLRIKPVLENYVLASYTRAVRFIGILGFTLDPPFPGGIDGRVYRRFHMSR